MSNLILNRVPNLPLKRVSDQPFQSLSVLWHEVSEKSLVTRCVILRLPKDSKHFLGTRNTVGTNVPLPMTHVRKPLGILQTPFALSQELTRPDLLSNVLSRSRNTNHYALIVSD